MMMAMIQLAISQAQDALGLGHTWEKINKSQCTAFKYTRNISRSPGENYVYIQHHNSVKKAPRNAPNVNVCV